MKKEMCIRDSAQTGRCVRDSIQRAPNTAGKFAAIVCPLFIPKTGTAASCSRFFYPSKEINGNAGGEFGQQNGKHGQHQIVYAVQRPRRPRPGGQHHDKRHAAPADDIVAESDGDALGFVLVAHPALQDDYKPV